MQISHNIPTGNKMMN